MRVSRLVTLFLLFAAAMQAPAQTPPPTTNPLVLGEWSAVRKWPFVAIHVALFPDGRIIGWSRKDGVTTLDTFVGDPKSGTFTNIPNTFVQPFCAGQTFLPDGRLLVAGGHDRFDTWGAIQTTIFDPRTNAWTKSMNMNAGRWYPTTSPLPNGDVLVVSGDFPPAPGVAEGSGRRNGLPQVWSPATGRWRDLTTAIDNGIELYPWMLLAPNGRVFMAGPRAGTAWLDTSGTGRWTPGPPSSVIFRDYGSAVMYEPGKVLIVGGGNPPQRTAETIDLNVARPEWKPTGSMELARRQMNATILPDGTVLATGGTNGGGFNDWRRPVLRAELWDPKTGTWRGLGTASVTRVYHSIAILLPDATVLNAGGGLPPWGEPPPPPPPGLPPYEAGPFHNSAQIYSPPYLFRGARPVIATAPAAIRYGERFTVATPNAADIGKVTFLHPGAVTHAFDQSQRFVSLSFTVEGGNLRVTAPANGNIAPPGHYMLFILSKNGVPSVAKWVTIQ
ncbi:MAG TPA: galactose oxidase-like domain-containing protein [Thermoanaerobaculia bacterium]|nr:galactose oxidase-like domain-containing protein [Thermoanaerobaculia bacterium]